MRPRMSLKTDVKKKMKLLKKIKRIVRNLMKCHPPHL